MYSRSGSHKLVLLGDTFVGKSSLVLRFVRGQFHDNLESTVGAAFMTQSVLMEGKTVKFEIWDTAGQERYRSLTPMYYRGARAAIVLYDITNPDTFECAKSWTEELSQRAGSVDVVALVGNKTDLESARRVSTQEAEEFAKSQQMIFYEISVKDAVNVDEIFIEIASRLPATRDSVFDDGLDSSYQSSGATSLGRQSLHGGRRSPPSATGETSSSRSCCTLL